MKFTILMEVITLLIKLSLKTKRHVRDMISVKNHTFVMMTKDGKSGRRFIIRNGTFSSDRILKDYDLAYVWKDSDTAFRVLTSNDPVGMHKAMANWDLEMRGDTSLSLWFLFFFGFATGILKRK
ncbi:MAG TPA: hypothetical protein VN416_07295 [Desulfomonilia bacterium]|jgi:hypothetical protein|nr:hypothetical protein [Thermodesulfobacteriota bacterium]HWR68810.1 hypothetical protein [Desulfomonilia bacterium]